VPTPAAQPRQSNPFTARANLTALRSRAVGRSGTGVARFLTGFGCGFGFGIAGNGARQNALLLSLLRPALELFAFRVSPCAPRWMGLSVVGGHGLHHSIPHSHFRIRNNHPISYRHSVRAAIPTIIVRSGGRVVIPSGQAGAGYFFMHRFAIQPYKLVAWRYSRHHAGTSTMRDRTMRRERQLCLLK